MTTSRCVGEPVSWLRLERFRLGELGGPEREAVAAHLAACPACAACVARIDADESLELPALALGPAAPRPPPTLPTRSPRRRLFASVAALAAAAVVVLGIGRTRRGPGTAVDGETARLKGDGMAFVLVRDDGQRVVDAEGVFRSGDRFKALVTCPPGSGATFDLVVFDGSGASFPLSPARGFACGNEVPLPGAFRLTPAGDRETVCVVWGSEDEVDRGALARSGVSGRRAMCKDLRAVGDGD
jgi:Putative zinc-finger